MRHVLIAAAVALGPQPALAWDPAGGPMRGEGAETIYVLPADPHAQLSGASAFTSPMDGAHRLIFKGGLKLSVPRQPSAALTAEQGLAICRQGLGEGWPTVAPGRAFLGAAPVTGDGAVQIIACPRDDRAIWHYLAARPAGSDWIAISRLVDGGVLTYAPATHTALVKSPHWIGPRGAEGQEAFLNPGTAGQLIAAMQEADEAVKSKLGNASLGQPINVELTRNGPGWGRVVVTAHVVDSGRPPIVPRGTAVSFFFLADAYLSGIDRLQVNLDPSQQARFFPAPVSVVATLHGPWMAYTPPPKPVAAAMPLFEGAETEKAAAPPTILLSLGVSAPPARIPQPGPGPAMTLATATDLFHGWVDAQPYFSDDLKRSKVLPFGGPLVAQSFEPMTPDGSLVMIGAAPTVFITTSNFVAVRSGGSWQIVAQCLARNGLLSWDPATGEGLATSDGGGALTEAALWSLRSRTDRFAIESVSQSQPGLEGETGIVKWTGQEAGKPASGELRFQLRNVAANLWRIKAS